MNDLTGFIEEIHHNPENTEFEEVISLIDRFYDYTPTRFTNGTGEETVENAAGENAGSCKIFSFALLHGFDEIQTLNCFGKYYREDVLMHPENTDHSNIRTFIHHGLEHLKFDSDALLLKK